MMKHGTAVQNKNCATVPRFSVYYSGIFAFDDSESVMSASFFLINSRPNEPEPQLQAIAEDAFCR